MNERVYFVSCTVSCGVWSGIPTISRLTRLKKDIENIIFMKILDHCKLDNNFTHY